MILWVFLAFGFRKLGFFFFLSILSPPNIIEVKSAMQPLQTVEKVNQTPNAPKIDSYAFKLSNLRFSCLCKHPRAIIDP